MRLFLLLCGSIYAGKVLNDHRIAFFLCHVKWSLAILVFCLDIRSLGNKVLGDFKNKNQVAL